MHVRMMTVHDHTNSYACSDAKIQSFPEGAGPVDRPSTSSHSHGMFCTEERAKNASQISLLSHRYRLIQACTKVAVCVKAENVMKGPGRTDGLKVYCFWVLRV